jgi:gamma-glutamylaminecyclotransferase
LIESNGEFLLFVYGTLMRDGPRAIVLAGQRYVDEARTTLGYALYDLGPYPGLIRQAGSGPVYGELVAVPASLRDRLDRIEGAPRVYCMEEISLEGIAQQVYSYFFQGNVVGFPMVENGRWDNRRSAPWNGGGP